MKPIDYRNETWDSLQQRLEGLRLAVYRAWEQHGPGTTRQLAERSGIDLLTFRPRSTELYQLGLLRLVNQEPGAGEGIYEAVPMAVAQAQFEREKQNRINPQLNLL